jgi:hypothetical protein
MSEYPKQQPTNQEFVKSLSKENLKKQKELYLRNLETAKKSLNKSQEMLELIILEENNRITPDERLEQLRVRAGFLI